MGKYTIKELESVSGIKAHTIRVWEQRHGILHPERVDNNLRLYSDQDLRHLLNVSLLNKNGYKISKISKMTEREIKEVVLSLGNENLTYGNQIDALTVIMVEYDEQAFERLLATNILRLGFQDTFIHIIFPFLHRIGLLWQTDIIRPTQEHFISNLIRQKVVTAIDGQNVKSHRDSLRFLLFLPEGELHEHSLLFLNYILRGHHHHSLYLGASVPFEDLQQVAVEYQPHFIATVCTAHPQAPDVQAFVDKLSAAFPDVHLIISGRQVVQAATVAPANCTILHTLEEGLSFFQNPPVAAPKL